MTLIILLITYLINVGIVNLIQFLVNITFGTDYNYNVWLLAVLFIIIQTIFKSKKEN